MDQAYLEPTTELEAINTMLSVIGEAPINTLEGALPADADIARRILEEVSREVQAKGWYFNTERNYPLLPNEEGEIVLPRNATHVDVSLGWNPGLEVVLRGQRLYNLTDHTFKFTGKVYVDIVFLLPFEELPQTARHYITIRAARKFHDRVVGSGTLHEFTTKDEQDALTRLRYDDARLADRSIFGRNIFSGWDVAQTIRRF